MKPRSRHVGPVLAVAALTFAVTSTPCGCRRETTPSKDTTTMNVQPIEKVLQEQTPGLMAIPGVVGVYQGQLEGGQSCITVMVIESTPDLVAKIPKSIAGYPVVIEAGGEIKPLGGRDSL